MSTLSRRLRAGLFLCGGCTLLACSALLDDGYSYGDQLDAGAPSDARSTAPPTQPPQPSTAPEDAASDAGTVETVSYPVDCTASPHCTVVAVAEAPRALGADADGIYWIERNAEAGTGAYARHRSRTGIRTAPVPEVVMEPRLGPTPVGVWTRAYDEGLSLRAWGTGEELCLVSALGVPFPDVAVVNERVLLTGGGELRLLGCGEGPAVVSPTSVREVENDGLHLWWVLAGSSQLIRAELDGGDQVAFGSAPIGHRLAVGDRNLFWTDFERRIVWSVGKAPDAGNGKAIGATDAGIAALAPSGDSVFFLTHRNVVRARIASTASTPVDAIVVGLGDPSGVVVFDGALYIADRASNRIVTVPLPP